MAGDLPDEIILLLALKLLCINFRTFEEHSFTEVYNGMRTRRCHRCRSHNIR
jgi:hypothetical protein